jgi:coenzyme F420-reducing hydrogenase delta subunit
MELEDQIRERVLVEWDVITESDWFREYMKEIVKEIMQELNDDDA